MDNLYYNAYLPQNYDFKRLFGDVSNKSSSDSTKVSSEQSADDYLNFRKAQKSALNEFGADTKISEARKELKQLKETKESSKSKLNPLKWLSNGVTALVNIGKTIVGIDNETGKWSPKKCLRNIVITAAAAGACFIPYVGPFIGYGLLTTGVVAGGIGLYKSSSKLYNAKTNKEIDNAQQDIWTNALMMIGSLFGLRSMGASFRTAAATSSQASVATTRTSIGGKFVEAMSNFGKDITVNAWRSTKYAAEMSALRARDIVTLDKSHRYAMKDLKADIQGRLSDVQSKLAAETDLAKKALLEEQKTFLEANLTEFNKIGPTIKSKADYEQLLSNSSSSFNKEWLNTTYTKNAAGEYAIGGQKISAELFDAFKRTNLEEQTVLNAKLYKLAKLKEALVYKYASNPAKYSRQLNKFIDITDVSKNYFKPSNWFKNEYEIAMSSNSNNISLNPFKFYSKPASTPVKFVTLAEPMNSESLLYPASETQEIAEKIKLADEKMSLLNKLKYATSQKDFEKLMSEYSSLESKYAEIASKAQQETNRQIATA